MMDLESIVLPLEQSRALVEHGIVLDTALVWAVVKDCNSQLITTVISRNDALAGCIGTSCDGQQVICGAPVLSELLDAIRAKTEADAEFSTGKYRMGRKVKTGLTVDWGEIGHTQGFGDTDLLAAAALLMEVSK